MKMKKNIPMPKSQWLASIHIYSKMNSLIYSYLIPRNGRKNEKLIEQLIPKVKDSGSMIMYLQSSLDEVYNIETKGAFDNEIELLESNFKEGGPRYFLNNGRWYVKGYTQKGEAFWDIVEDSEEPFEDLWHLHSEELDNNLSPKALEYVRTHTIEDILKEKKLTYGIRNDTNKHDR